MKKLTLFILTLFITTSCFSQAQESDTDTYKKVYEIIIIKDGEVKHVVKEGALISADIDGKTANGQWFFSDYPDKVVVINRKGENVGVVELNKQDPLRIVTPQPKSGMRVGIGVGPVSVSNVGPGYQSFNMEKYKVELSERLETKEEKLRREYAEKKEQERLAKEAAKQAKKDAKKKKKNR
jgi:hypothetical protein